MQGLKSLSHVFTFARRASLRQVVDQTVWILHIAARKVRLVFHDFTTARDKLLLRFFHIAHRHFQYWPEQWTFFNEQIDLVAVQVDPAVVFAGDREAKLLYVEL